MASVVRSVMHVWIPLLGSRHPAAANATAVPMAAIMLFATKALDSVLVR